MAKPDKNKSLPLYAVVLASIYVFLTRGIWGRVLSVSLISAFVILIQMLIWRQHAQLFFSVLGAELIVLIVIGWLFFLIHKESD